MDYLIRQDIETVIELQDNSTDEFSKNLGVSRITVSNWINNKTEIKAGNIAAFYEYAYMAGIRLNKIKEQIYKEDSVAKEDVLLFHGAKEQIKGELSLEYSRDNNDFGKGFYCGESLEQSAMFVSTFNRACLYMLKFKKKGLKYIQYDVNRDWMLLIAYYRKRLGEYAESETIKKLVERNKDVDYIIAPIADNRMFEIIDQFIDGEITDIQCQHCLSATNLGYQYVFKTDKALHQIEILERCYLAEAEKDDYLKSRQESYELGRDKVKLARKQFRNQGEYIEDILK